MGSFQVAFDFVLQTSAGRVDSTVTGDPTTTSTDRSTSITTVGIDGTGTAAGSGLGLGLAQGALDINGVWSDGSGGLVSWENGGGEI